MADPDMSLGERFLRSESEAIRVDGRDVHLAHEVRLPAGSGLEIRVVSFAKSPKQSVRVSLTKESEGSLATASGIEGRHLKSWAKNLSAGPEWQIWNPGSLDSDVRIWNCWTVPGISGDVGGTGEAGIVVEWKTSGWWILHCSCGMTRDFEQLVLDVRLIGPTRFKPPDVGWLTRFLNRLPFR